MSQTHLETKSQIVVAIGSVLVLLLLFPAVGSPLVSYTATVYMTIFNSNFFVDTNISNVDSVFDSGTHSDFSDQQSGPDSNFDKLTEEAMGSESGYRVQQGDFLFQGTNDFVPLDYAVNMTYSFALMPNIEWQENVTASTSGDPVMNSDDDMATVYLYNSTHLRVQRYASDDGDLRIGWQVLECVDEEFIVQRGEKLVSSFTDVITSDTIPIAVNAGNSLAWHYFRTSTTSNDGRVIQFYSNVTDSATITFTRQSTTSISGYFRWIVVEWDLSKIDHFAQGYVTGFGTDASPFIDSVGTAINESQSILVFQTHAIGDDGLDTSATAGYFLNDTHVAFYNYASSFNRGIKWYVIDFGSGVGSRQDTDQIAWASSDYVNDDILNSAVQTNRTLVWLSGSCNGDGTAKPRHTQWWVLNPTNSTHSTSLHYERRYGGQNREVAWQVLELPYSSSEEEVWYDSNWNCRKKITIDYAKVEADFNDFPILVNMTDTELRDYAQNDGDDILFTKSDGTTKLSHEIEMFNGTTGQLITWVKANISATISSVLYVYYGNPSASNQENISDVWSNGYAAVYHLNGGSFLDSTSNGHHGTNYGSSDTTGKIAGARDFYPADGVDYISIGNWNVPGNQLTLQAWINPDNFGQDDPRVVSKAEGTAGAPEQEHVFMLSLIDGSSGENRLRFRLKTGTLDTDGTTTLIGTPPNSDLQSSGSWYLAAATYDGSNMEIIRDGLNSGSTSKTGSLRQNSWSIQIGNQPSNTDTNSRSFDGKIDEVRISSVVRSASWFETEYNNQYNSSSFYSIGIEEEPTSTSSNYEVDLEVQWTDVDFDEVNEELCIYGGVMGSENIKVDVWSSGAWQNLFTDLNSGWNNVTVSSYLTASTFTIRFKGSNEAGDATQDNWSIDATLLHVWS